jgi:hypothetical protein
MDLQGGEGLRGRGCAVLVPLARCDANTANLSNPRLAHPGGRGSNGERWSGVPGAGGGAPGTRSRVRGGPGAAARRGVWRSVLVGLTLREREVWSRRARAKGRRNIYEFVCLGSGILIQRFFFKDLGRWTL